MSVAFVKDVGYRLSANGRSMILGSMAFGKIGVTLNDRELVSYSGVMDGYFSELGGRSELPRRAADIVLAAAPPLADDVAYKFTDDAAIPYWKRGSIRLNPPATYKTIETETRRDAREGLGTVYLAGPERFALMTSQSGFNALVLCTSADARKSERPDRHRRFGSRLLKIHRASEFARKIAELLGALRFTIRDVTYSNAAVVKAAGDHVSEWAELNGLGNLNSEFVERLSSHHLDELVAATMPASIFCKPTFYRPERERRFLFEMPEDAGSAVSVEDSSLAEHIELMT